MLATALFYFGEETLNSADLQGKYCTITFTSVICLTGTICSTWYIAPIAIGLLEYFNGLNLLDLFD
jgi:hypothetical protein